ncbi:hypothetical protein R9C00_03940 [Flammeovirgaceae bacterium SG7u.111]|nr:hypothetical protein [Flammeovirgaceae bacterium SG7u.132]WPO36597.1 hypothetical protein R9C00_03940 [Flammeovirgaceae bacterium SG7u.111]
MILSFLFRTKKFKIAEFTDHYQLYVKLIRFGKYVPIKSAKVAFNPHDVDSQVDALMKVKEIKTTLLLKDKPLFLES